MKRGAEKQLSKNDHSDGEIQVRNSTNNQSVSNTDYF